MGTDDVYRRIMATRDALPYSERKRLGPLSVRLHVPLVDPIDLRRCCGIGIATLRHVQTVTHRKGVADWEILSVAREVMEQGARCMRDRTSEEDFLRTFSLLSR